LSAEDEETEAVNPAVIREWAKRSYDTFSGLVSREIGIARMTLHRLGSSEKDAPDVKDLVPNLTYRILDGAPAEMSHVWTFPSFVIDMPQYMKWLASSVEELGVVSHCPSHYSTLQEAITETAATLLVNCAGLGARELCNDTSLRGVKGVLLLKQSVGLSGIVSWGEYVLAPRMQELVAGALYEPEYTSERVEQGEVDRLERQHSTWPRACLDLVGTTSAELKAARTLDTVTGLRPVRAGGVRFGLQEIAGCKVLHNYGHGGAGVTLSWGSAIAVRDMIMSRTELVR